MNMKTKLDFTEGRLERSEGRLDYLKRDRDEWSSLAANRKDELKVSSDSLGAFKAENEALQDRAQFLETANKSLCQGLDEGKERESKLSNQLLQARDELAEAQTTMRQKNAIATARNGVLDTLQGRKRSLPCQDWRVGSGA